MRKTFISELPKSSITEQVKSIEDLYKVAGLTSHTYIELSDDISHLYPFMSDMVKYILLVQTLNEGWKPNWDYKNEKKWYPFFNMQTGGFSLLNVHCFYEASLVPSRLCFRTRELAEHAVKYFPDLLKSVFTNI